jgi:hypothetical protein
MPVLSNPSMSASLPKSKFKDLVDSTTQAVTWMRKHGLIAHNFEVAAELREQMMRRPPPRALTTFSRQGM